MKIIRRAQSLIDGQVALGRRAETLQNIINWKQEKGFLTKAQRKLVKDIEIQLKDYPYDQKLCDKLVTAYNKDLTPKESESFIRSVVSSFEETHTWSPLQREQILLIVEKVERAGDISEED